MMISFCADGLPCRALKQLISVQVLHRQETKSASEVPLIFRENCLLSGYRVPNKPWSYYLASFFQLHNESGNIWSHFVALLIFLYKVYELCCTFDLRDDPMSWPVLAFSFAIVLYAAFSTFAHLFQSKSPLVHYTCFQIDYIGIGLNAFGTGCLFYYLTGTRSYYDVIGPTAFMVINALLAVGDCVTCSLAKLWYSRPYPPQRRIWQLGVVGGHVVFGSVPCLCYFKHCLVDDPECGLFRILPYLHVFGWFLLSVYFFSSAMPERTAPGRFDLLGHGHQIFHVLITVTSLLQLHIALRDYQHRPRDLMDMAMPDPVVIFGSMASVLLLDALFIIFTHKVRLTKIANDVVHEKEYTKTNKFKNQ